MKTVVVSKMLLSPISLPGMGRSIDLAELAEMELMEIRSAFAKGELFVEFREEAGSSHPIINLWMNPHSSQVTLFIK